MRISKKGQPRLKIWKILSFICPNEARRWEDENERPKNPSNTPTGTPKKTENRGIEGLKPGEAL